MKASFSSLALLSLSWLGVAQAACSTNLLIDNYANYAQNLNSLGQWTSGKSSDYLIIWYERDSLDNENR
jgi:hypothetical protein